MWYTQLSSVILLLASTTAFASTNLDRDFIKKQAGCYEVTFRFAETFPLQADYKIRQPYHTKGVEWVEVLTDNERRVDLQHILIIPGGGMKHWRQVWDYEPDSVWDFKSQNTWQKRRLSEAEQSGSWAQRVYQVDDSPRYECAAPWHHHLNSHYWECEAWSPLPRREFSQRSDYNVLVRRNRHEINGNAFWTHEQDNLKLRVEGQNQTAIVKEKGENIYKRLPDEQCAVARKFWAETGSAWLDIQAVWEEVYQNHDVLRFKDKVNGNPLWVEFFQLAFDAMEAPVYNADDVKQRARQLINSYLE